MNWRRRYRVLVAIVIGIPLLIAIWAALRFNVPLNSKCSMKWVMPFNFSVSFRDPDFSQTPMLSERT